MIFKKKYKRTEWMNGLLEAEELIKEKPTFVGGVSHILRGCTEYEDGVYDYLEHYEENKEILSNGLDK